MIAIEATAARPDAAARGKRSAPALVRRELARALLDLVLLPPRALKFMMERRKLRAELLALLDRSPARAPDPPVPLLPARPLRIFVSCAEASGEIHALSLVRALRKRIAVLGAPPPTIVGIGGARLAAEGVRLVAAPVDRASMGFKSVLESLPYYCDLLRSAAEHVERDHPDVCVPIDSPALHVPLARIARHHGVPVVHFVAPQYWGWAPWRARAYSAAVDRALTILPFEAEWFRRRGVSAVHVGHPLLDALAEIPAAEIREQRPVLVLLPGSRKRVMELNLPWMLDAADRLLRRRGDLLVVVAHARAENEAWLREAVRARGLDTRVAIEAGDLHRSLARASAALSVSGTVLIDLLHHRLPAVVIYRLASPFAAWLSTHVLTVPWFSSVNLLAAREVYPEFTFHGDGPVAEIDAAIDRCLFDADARAQCRRDLTTASARLGPPGAVERATLHVLELALRSEAASGGREAARSAAAP